MELKNSGMTNNDWINDYFHGFIAGAGFVSVVIVAILIMTGAV